MSIRVLNPNAQVLNKSEALHMTIKDLAKHLGVSRVALSELVNERRGCR